MSQREPIRLPFSSLEEMIDSSFLLQGVKPHFGQGFAIVHGANTLPAVKSFLQPSVPYRVDDYRFVIFHGGDFEVTANLRKYHITGNAIGVMGNGGIIQMDSITALESMSGLLLKEDYLRLAMGGKLPSIFTGGQHNNYINVTQEELAIADGLIVMLRALVDVPDHNPDAVSSLVATIVNYFGGLIEHKGKTRPAAQSRPQRVFEQFLDLVNEHCKQHHTLDFYADRLCITQRYLGTLVRQASGTTAKDWIDRAIISEAKVGLKHSDATVAQLADTLGFPNAAFFCKFFKRLTGMTPTQYQQS